MRVHTQGLGQAVLSWECELFPSQTNSLIRSLRIYKARKTKIPSNKKASTRDEKEGNMDFGAMIMQLPGNLLIFVTLT